MVIRPYAFTDYKPSAGRQSRPGFIHAKQEILGDVHHVHRIHEIELSRRDALSVPG